MHFSPINHSDVGLWCSSSFLRCDTTPKLEVLGLDTHFFAVTKFTPCLQHNATNVRQKRVMSLSDQNLLQPQTLSLQSLPIHHLVQIARPHEPVGLLFQTSSDDERHAPSAENAYFITDLRVFREESKSPIIRNSDPLPGRGGHLRHPLVAGCLDVLVSLARRVDVATGAVALLKEMEDLQPRVEICSELWARTHGRARAVFLVQDVVVHQVNS